MVSGNRYTGGKGSEAEENFTVQLTNPMLYDRLHILSFGRIFRISGIPGQRSCKQDDQ